MNVPTTTIRVPYATRDKLSLVAAGRGVSVSQLLTDQAAAWVLDEWFRQEREASQSMALEPGVREEQDLWDATDDDWD